MTKEEFNNLKKGDVITQNSQYFIVYDRIDETFIDTQELTEIGKLNALEFYTHSNINHNYSEVVTDKVILDGINKWLKTKEVEYEPYSFIRGYISGYSDLTNILNPIK